MKGLIKYTLLFFLMNSTFAQNTTLPFFIESRTRILKNGFFTELTLGKFWNKNISGDLIIQYEQESSRNSFAQLTESLNASKKIYINAFLLPYSYHFVNTKKIGTSLGGGIFYEYENLDEYGYFNMPELTSLGFAAHNNFSNIFSAHTIGPLASIRARMSLRNFEVVSQIGLVPFFYFIAKQDMTIAPLVTPSRKINNQNVFGSPYIFAQMNIDLFKFFSIDFFYDYSRLQYDLLDFAFIDSSTVSWIKTAQQVNSHTAKLEANFHYLSFRIGGGYKWNIIQYGNTSKTNSMPYFIFSIGMQK